MGQELRSIVLNEDEFLVAAGLYFDGDKDSPIVSSNIRAVAVTALPDAPGEITLHAPLVDGQQNVSCEPQQLIEMVVAFCKQKAIPLPRHGKKTVLRRGDSVVLEIETDWF